jgi:molybdenum cofactor cytidylyltransferase
MASKTIVVLGANVAELSEEIREMPVQIVINTNWKQGIGTSIAAGMSWILGHENDLDAVVLTVCDQPHLSQATIDHLIQEFQATQHPIVASSYDGTLGVPVLFGCKYFSELSRLEGQTGAKALILSHLDQVARVPFSGGAIDLDTPEQVQAFLGAG